jgi:short-subunit dehydrogenase
VRSLQGKRILVTGCSSGIGQAIAQCLAAKGARLALAARTLDKLNDFATTLSAKGTEVLAVPTDVTVVEDRERLLAAIQAKFGGLDILINNAGVASFGHFAGSTEAILRQVMEVNFFAPAELIRQAIPMLTLGIQPAIVNVSSMCGRRGMPAWPEYSASKFALCGLTEALRGEMVRFDVDVLLVLPGLTRSDLVRNLLRNEGRMKIDFAAAMAPEQVAQTIVRSIEGNKPETQLGRDTRWMLRFQRYFPWLVDRLLKRKVRQLYRSTNDNEDADLLSGVKSSPCILKGPHSITEQKNTGISR